QGYDVMLVNLRSLSPVDAGVILRCASVARLLVTVEDHFRIGGLNSIVAETLSGAGQTIPVLSISMEDRWFRPALLHDVLNHEGFTGPQIAGRVQKALRASGVRPGDKRWKTASL